MEANICGKNDIKDKEELNDAHDNNNLPKDASIDELDLLKKLEEANR